MLHSMPRNPLQWAEPRRPGSAHICVSYCTTVSGPSGLSLVGSRYVRRFPTSLSGARELTACSSWFACINFCAMAGYTCPTSYGRGHDNYDFHLASQATDFSAILHMAQSRMERHTRRLRRRFSSRGGRGSHVASKSREARQSCLRSTPGPSRPTGARASRTRANQPLGNPGP